MWFQIEMRKSTLRIYFSNEMQSQMIGQQIIWSYFKSFFVLSSQKLERVLNRPLCTAVCRVLPIPASTIDCVLR